MAAVEPAIPDTLAPDELDALFSALGGRGKLALRNRALLMVMHDAALRIGEAVKLRPADVDVKSGDVRVYNGKGGKSRLVPDCLHPDTKQALTAWLTRRDALGWDERSARLFGTFYGRDSGGKIVARKGGGPLDASAVRRLLRSLAVKAALTKPIYPHLLRHTRARQWSAEGLPVADIKAWLGHSSLNTTTIYLAELNPAGVGAGQRERRTT